MSRIWSHQQQKNTTTSVTFMRENASWNTFQHLIKRGMEQNKAKRKKCACIYEHIICVFSCVHVTKPQTGTDKGIVLVPRGQQTSRTFFQDHEFSLPSLGKPRTFSRWACLSAQRRNPWPLGFPRVCLQHDGAILQLQHPCDTRSTAPISQYVNCVKTN